MKEKAQKTLEKIIKLKDEIAEKTAELERLLLSIEDKKSPSLPNGFALSNEIIKIVESQTTTISANKVLEILTNKFPDYGIDKQKVNSALVYLAGKARKIERADRGEFRKKHSTGIVIQ